MATKSGEEPVLEGPTEPGGKFVLLGEEQPGLAAEAELAQGSDVVDVGTLDRELERRRLDDMLRRYLEE